MKTIFFRPHPPLPLVPFSLPFTVTSLGHLIKLSRVVILFKHLKKFILIFATRLRYSFLLLMLLLLLLLLDSHCRCSHLYLKTFSWYSHIHFKWVRNRKTFRFFSFSIKNINSYYCVHWRSFFSLSETLCASVCINFV
jgi:hypothetical protein